MMMNKVIVLLLVLVAAASGKKNLDWAFKQLNLDPEIYIPTRSRSLANECPSSLICAATNAVCGFIPVGTTDFNFAACSGTDYCNATTVLSPGNCVKNVVTGAPCAGITGPLGGGSECAPTDVCFGTPSTCQTVTYTATVGQACSDLHQCAGKLDCNESSICVATASTGQACNEAQDLECGDASSCINNKCVAFGSAGVGGNCSSPLDCKGGLFCNLTVCATPPANQGTNCNEDSDCNTYQQCQCTSTGGKICVAPSTISSSLLSEITSLLNCFYDNSCANPLTCSSCSISKACQLLADEAQFADGQKVPTCFIGGPCETSSSATVAISAAAVVAALLLML